MRGLGLAPLRVIPHYDAYFSRAAGLIERVLGEHEGIPVVGIDEETAVCFDNDDFFIVGEGNVNLLRVQP